MLEGEVRIPSGCAIAAVISKEGNILDMAVNLDIVEKAGSWFSYNGERIGQGRENVKRYLHENPEMLEDIEEKVRESKISSPAIIVVGNTAAYHFITEDIGAFSGKKVNVVSEIS